MLTPSSQPTPVRVDQVAGPPTGMPADPVTPQVRWDGTELTPNWNPPTWTDSLPRRTKVVSVLAFLVVLGVGIWALGGWKANALAFPLVAGDSVIRTGPFELTFVKVVFTRSDQSDDSSDWTVKVLATCRNISGEGQEMTTVALGDVVIAGGPLPDGTTAVSRNNNVILGDWGRYSMNRNGLAPELVATPCTFTSILPGQLVPQALTSLLVYDLVWQGRTVDRDAGWQYVTTGVRLQVPGVIEPVG